MARSPARRRRNPYIKRGDGDGAWCFYGPLVADAVTGKPWPKREMIRQRGGFVHQRFGRGSGRDREPNY